MSVENVKKFYKRIEEDKAFRTEITNDETLKDIIMDRLIAVVRSHRNGIRGRSRTVGLCFYQFSRYSRLARFQVF